MEKRRLDAANKSAAAIQITAEQLIREAASLSGYDEPAAVNNAPVFHSDSDLIEYKVKKRKEFEDILRRRRIAPNVWIAYGRWEAECLEFERARSVFERGLSIDYECIEVWNAYIDMELKYNFKNSARNLLERVCTVLPRIDHFWLRYLLLEENEKNFEICAKIFKRWLAIDYRNLTIWFTYIRFLNRHAGAVKESSPEAAVIELLSDSADQKIADVFKFLRKSRIRISSELYNQIKDHVERLAPQFHEIDSAAVLLNQAILEVNQSRAPDYDRLYNVVRIYQNKFSVISSAIVQANLDELSATPARDRTKPGGATNALAHTCARPEYTEIDTELLEESAQLRALYDLIISALRPKTTSDWKKWIFIALNYCILLEVYVKFPFKKVDEIYIKIESILSQNKILSNKFYTLYSDYLIRNNELQRSRLLLGKFIGLLNASAGSTNGPPVSKIAKIYAHYVNNELRLNQIDRCRKLSANFIQAYPAISASWLLLIDIELLLSAGATSVSDRVDKLFELAISSQTDPHHSNVLWKTYIDVNRDDHDKLSNLYSQYFASMSDPMILVDQLQYEWKIRKDPEAARAIALKAIGFCKSNMLNSERATVTHLRWQIEKEFATPFEEEAARALPTRVRKRRKITRPDGEEVAEEFTAYIFPEDNVGGSAATSAAKMLEAARKYAKTTRTS